MSNTDKSTNISDIFKGLVDERLGIKKRNISLIKDVSNIHVEKFSSGSFLLDKELLGGYPKGTITELYGRPGGGKTTLSVEAAAQHQNKYPKEPILWLDLEGVFDEIYFKNIGVDVNPERFILSQPLSGEDAFEIIKLFVENYEGGLVVVDSVALLLPKKEAEADIEDAQMMLHARLMSRGIKNIFAKAQENDTTIILINQIRETPTTYGDPDKPTGGNTVPHYARTRIKTTRHNDKSSAGVGINNIFKLVKANWGRENAEVKTNIIFGVGIDYINELITLGKEFKIFEMSGSWFSFKGNKLANGAKAMSELLEDNWEVLDEIEDEVLKCLENYYLEEKERRKGLGGVKTRKRK